MGVCGCVWMFVDVCGCLCAAECEGGKKKTTTQNVLGKIENGIKYKATAVK